MADTIQFVGGDDLVEPFQITANGAPVDLTGAVVSGRVRSRVSQVSFDLAPGAGLEMSALAPTGTDPHGFIVLSELQTASLPIGAVSDVRISVMDQNGLVASTFTHTLERLP